jgi:D-cysteine desulfhydrase family pyridoxal phosphate-dependent enzyme
MDGRRLTAQDWRWRSVAGPRRSLRMSHGITDFPRLPLAFLPTPLHDAPALSKFLGGPRILIKRDDQTGLAIGGNKARKLEFLLAAARLVGADTLLTTGASDSNHCRMTAAAAAQYGLKCVLLLGAKSETPVVQGNLLLDDLFGAEVQFYPAGGASGNDLLPEVASALRARGDNVFAFPSGGSTGLGALGYALMVRELLDQLAAQDVQADYVLHASGSGGTHAGLLLGKALFDAPFEILAINVDAAENSELEARTRGVYAEGARMIGAEELPLPPFNLLTGYVGDGYGVMSLAGAEAIRETARREGILLDPVYTGKAMAALFDLARGGRFRADETVIFVHTGGTPALFTQSEAVIAQVNGAKGASSTP